ncbi:hypothetical protein [Streptomyces griseoflavus]|uniref:hypothetical protein n=1 Tax=Streptomyces griseoflavus TaxID=35619 RepID=UPI003D752B93
MRFEPNLRPLTAATYETTVRLHIVPLLGSKRLDRLTVQDGEVLRTDSVEAFSQRCPDRAPQRVDQRHGRGTHLEERCPARQGSAGSA